MYKSKLDIQIRFADIDSLHHVNTVNIQHYFDMGKRDFLKNIINIGELFGEHSMVQANINTDFKQPIFLDDNIYVETMLSRIGNKSFSFYQHIICKETGNIKAESKSTLVSFNTRTQISEDMSDEWRKCLEKAL